MNAKEARSKYFEDYVSFEHIVRKLARRIIKNYKTKNKGLRQIILDISKETSLKGFNIPVKKIETHRKIRNWLAHSPFNYVVSKKYLIKMKKINAFSKFLEYKKTTKNY